MQIWGGFSPVNAVKQVGSVINHTGGVTNYDVFGNLGNQKSLQSGSSNGSNDNNSSGGVYWVGQDGNVWVSGSGGTNSAGNYDSNSDNYWNSRGYSRINDPSSGGVTSTGGGSSSRSGGSGSSSKYNPADLAWIDSQIANTQGQYGLIDDALNRGRQDLQNSYQGAVNDANKQRERALEGYQIQRDTTERGKTNALNRVDDNARQLLNSLRQRIAQAGGANSSAYLQAAPNMVAQQSGSNRNDVMENYGANFMNLARAERYAEDDYKDLLGQIGRDRDTRLRDLQVGIDQQKQGLDSELARMQAQRAEAMGGNSTAIRNAMQPYLDQRNARENAIRDIYNRYSTVTAPRALDVQKVNLRDYMIDRANQQANEQAGTQDDPTAYYRPRPQDDEDKLV